MNIYTIRDNLKNTIAGKEQMLASITEPTTNEAKQGWSIVHDMLSTNINELERILQDVELAITEVDAIPAPQPAIPPGYKLVPAVTEAMEAAGAHAWMTADGVDPIRVFNAMSAAADIPPNRVDQPAEQESLVREQLLVTSIEYEKAQAQKYFELYNQACGTAQLRLKEIARLESRLAAQRQPAARDDYKALYDEAMCASNEAGFVGLDAAETIREFARQLAETSSTR